VSVDAHKYGPWAVIFGGSEGIGSAAARDLAAAGINSVLIARKPEPLLEVAAELRDLGVEARTLSLDLTAPDMLDQVRAVTDDLDIGLSIYNAGASHKTGAYLHWQLEDALKVITLNTTAPAAIAHHFAQRMAKRGRGGIVTMGSLAGNGGSPSVVPYAGAKAFEQVFAEGLWWELKQVGVDVLHVVVGATDTPAMARLGVGGTNRDTPEYVAQLALDKLANGPVVVVASFAERFNFLATPDRRAATESNAELVMGNTRGTWIEDA
jgi:short-subunit dehydrogenase